MTLSHRYCPDCGAACEERVPDDDFLPRAVCTACGHVHYRNPKVVVGCIVTAASGELLLCRRDIEPARGRWTFPAGYLECGESCPEGAARETREESEADVEIEGLFALLDIPHIGQAYVVYRARLSGDHFGTTPESSEVRLVAREDVPWGELAFPSVATALRLFVEDGDARRVHSGVIEWSGEGSRFDLERYRLRDHRVSG